MSKLRSLLPYAVAAYAWSRDHKRVVLTVAGLVLTNVVSLIWADVPTGAILNALGALLGS